ncbi:MAG: hypothetical protein KKB62_01815 [Nanoarchaeota archaeon]|nr:hypothetical protein [Nanoarchaeota archaeon]
MGNFSRNLSTLIKDFKRGYDREKEIRKRIIKEKGPFLYRNTHEIYEFTQSFENSLAMKFGRNLYNGIHPMRRIESQEVVIDYLLSHMGLFVKN